MRSNLDPFSRYDDAKLYDALRRSHLVAAPPSDSGTAEEGIPGRPLLATKFSLDTPVEAEGANLSVGERSLLSLARALVRDEIKLVIMDEATASVDVETDSAIQETISKEFGGKTLLCIARTSCFTWFISVPWLKFEYRSSSDYYSLRPRSGPRSRQYSGTCGRA